MTRREFLQAVAAGTLVLPVGGTQRANPPRGDTLDPGRLRKWVQALPRLARAQPVDAGGDRYRITMRAAADGLHPDLPPTRCWTFDGHFPGPLLEAERGRTLAVEWVNALPARHFLPVDTSLPGAAAGLPPVRAVVHLHGARVPAASDGNPEDWIVPGQTQHCRYPNRQEAALLYYHDHAMGLDRLNVYAGLLGLYIVRDAAERELGLPTGEHEIPLLLCDRWLDAGGQLYYPTSGDPRHPWVPEVFGNALLLNGALWPELRVEPTRVRLRLANGCNGRFLQLTLAAAVGAVSLEVIGCDQGRLPRPVQLAGSDAAQTLAPGERSDWLVDFTALAGQTVYLNNDGRAVMRVRVGAGGRQRSGWRAAAVPAAGVTAAGDGADDSVDGAPVARTRRLTLDEYTARDGNPAVMLLDGKRWSAPVSERPRLGEHEIWEMVNLTGDTHPIHLHLVRFRILDRRALDADAYIADGTLRFTAAAEPPALAEAGWKDTVRCPAVAMTRILVHFAPYAGRYAWHCHVLEHEANEMMRPLEILG